MGWSGSLSASSAVGSSITYTPDTTTSHAYTIGTFTAPKAGVYQFVLRGSGGFSRDVSGGAGGYTVGYINMTANQTVYVGAGGTCSAAFVSDVSGNTLSSIALGHIWYIAGAGGSGGRASSGSGWNNKRSVGGAGGGSSGAEGGLIDTVTTAYGGSQTAGGWGSGGTGSYGAGAIGQYHNDGGSGHGGDGGDGYYGGGAGQSYGGEGGAVGGGGGGGSGYVWTSSITAGGTTYTNSTTQGNGAASDNVGSVVVTYYATSMLPIYYNGTQLSKIIYNGTTLTSLIYNGTKIF